MNTKFGKCFLLAVLALATVSCQRATSESSQVALQLPTYKNETALSCTTCLKAIIVNVNSENFKTIVFNQRMDKMGDAGSELAGEVILDIPSGLARKIQILAVYLLPNGTTQVQYGAKTVDLLVAEPPPITIALTSLGLFKQGSIVGRYLVLGNQGPTGNVIISMSDAASGMNMDILKAEMVEGWFDFLASETFPMSYRFESGIPIPEFQNITVNSLMPLAGGSPVNHIARIHRPSNYFLLRNSIWTPVIESHDIVYGFFGGSILVPTKRVCLEHVSSISNFTKLSSDPAGTPPLRFDEGSDTTADIYGINLIPNSLAVTQCNHTVSDPLYRSDAINVTVNQFDGNGNDTAKAIAGAFSYVVGIGNVIKKLRFVAGPPDLYRVTTLPGTFSNQTGANEPFDGAKLFKRANSANGGFDDVKCLPFWLELAGFVETPMTNPTLSNPVNAQTGGVFQFSLPTVPVATDGYILCPTKGGFLTGFGGFYLGALPLTQQ